MTRESGASPGQSGYCKWGVDPIGHWVFNNLGRRVKNYEPQVRKPCLNTRAFTSRGEGAGIVVTIFT